MYSKRVSVVIPTKNRSVELKRAIKSVLAQTHQDFEILVVDDHSEEDIEAVIKPFNDSRIKYYKSDKNPSNANVCRNIGLENAKGEYVAMLDSDDEWLLNHLRNSLDYLESKNLDGVFGGFFLDNGTNITEVRSKTRRKGEKFVNYLLSGGIAVTPSHVYKADCCKLIQWDESLLRHQDFDYGVRFAEQFSFESSPHIGCVVHWKKGELRTESFDSQIAFIEKNKKDIIEKNYSSYHRNTFNRIKNRSDIADFYIKHFKKESLRFIKVISLNDFMNTFGEEKGRIYKIYLRLKFSVLTILS